MNISPEVILDILYAGNVGLLIADSGGCVVWGNAHYEKITGLCMKELIGVNVEHIITAKNHISIKGTDETLRSIVLRKKQTVHKIMNFNNASDVIVTTTPVFNNGSVTPSMLYVLVDWKEVSDLKGELYRAYEKTEESRLRLQEAMIGEILNENEIIARDKRTFDSYSLALRISKVDATVLILGETGTGKGRFAKFVHKSGARKDGMFVHVNCSAIPESLFESELFGYERGAFTGAEKKGKMGLIELANEGTLFLDEIAELPFNMQAKLLTVLQSKELMRIGGTKPYSVDIRIIAATNRDLAEMVKEKMFREDLFYRLNVLEVKLPPLRESLDDIPVLIDHFTKTFNDKYHLNKKCSSGVLDILTAYEWPGNIRELENLVERLVIMSPEDEIGFDSLPKNFNAENLLINSSNNLKQVLERVENMMIRKAIKSTPTLKEAADELGIELSTLTRKKQKYGIYKED